MSIPIRLIALLIVFAATIPARAGFITYTFTSDSSESGGALSGSFRVDQADLLDGLLTRTDVQNYQFTFTDSLAGTTLYTSERRGTRRARGGPDHGDPDRAHRVRLGGTSRGGDRPGRPDGGCPCSEHVVLAGDSVCRPGQPTPASATGRSRRRGRTRYRPPPASCSGSSGRAAWPSADGSVASRCKAQPFLGDGRGRGVRVRGPHAGERDGDSLRSLAVRFDRLRARDERSGPGAVRPALQRDHRV